MFSPLKPRSDMGLVWGLVGVCRRLIWVLLRFGRDMHVKVGNSKDIANCKNDGFSIYGAAYVYESNTDNVSERGLAIQPTY